MSLRLVTNFKVISRFRRFIGVFSDTFHLPGKQGAHFKGSSSKTKFNFKNDRLNQEKRLSGRDTRELRGEIKAPSYNVVNKPESFTIYDAVSLPESDFSCDDLGFCQQLCIDLNKLSQIKESCHQSYILLSNLEFEQQISYVASRGYLYELIIFCAYQRNPHLTKIILSEMRNRGTFSNHRFLLVCLMTSLARAGDIPGARALLKEVSRLGFEKDPRFWSLLLEAHTTANDIEGGFLVLEELKLKEIIPTLEMYDNLLEVCVRFNDLNRAWHLFEFVRVKLYEPNLRTYNIMITACSKSKSVEKAICLFEEVVSKNLNKNIDVYNALLSSYCSRDDYCDRVFNVLGMIISANIIPNNTTYELLISAAAKGGSSDLLKILLQNFYEKMKSEKYSGRFFESSKILSDIVDTYANLLANSNSRNLITETTGLSVNSYTNTSKDSALDPSTNATANNSLGGSNILDISATPHASPFNQNKHISSLLELINFTIDPRNNKNETKLSTSPQPEGKHNFLISSQKKCENRFLNSLQEVSLKKLETLEKSVYLVEDTDSLSSISPLDHIASVWEYIILKPEFTTSQILDSYLKLLIIYASNTKDDEFIMNFFSEAYTKLGTAHGLNTYTLMLTWVGTSRERSLKYSWITFDSYLKFDHKMEVTSFGPPMLVLTPLNRALQELERKRQSRSKHYTKNNFALMANALAISGDVDGSLSIIEKANTFRYHGYLPKIHQEEVIDVFRCCYKFIYSDNFKPLARFYSLVTPSEKKYFTHSEDKVTSMCERASAPFLEPPEISSDFIIPLTDKEPDICLYPFYPSLHKRRKKKKRF